MNRRHTRWTALLLCTGLLLAASPAVGQDVDDGLESEARALFDAGRTAYSNGRYESAAEYFQRAYDLSGQAALLYNVGSAMERAGRDGEALEAYRAFLATDPGGPERLRAESSVAILERNIAAARPEPAVPEDATPETATPEPDDAPVAEAAVAAEPPAPTVSRASSGGPGAAPWILFGGGLAVAAVGGVLLGLGLADQDAVDNAPQGSLWMDISNRQSRGEAFLTTGWILLPVGGVLAIGGLLWALLGGGGDGGDERAGLSVDVGLGSLHVRGAF